MSVPQMPTARVSTSTGPSDSGGSSTSESSAEPFCSGTTVSAFTCAPPRWLGRRRVGAGRTGRGRRDRASGPRPSGRRSPSAVTRRGGQLPASWCRAADARSGRPTEVRRPGSAAELVGAPSAALGVDRLLAGQPAGRVDQGDVGEGLGEVADQAPATASYSSESSPRSLRRPSRRSKSVAGVVGPPDHVQAVGQPERAGQEGPLPP